MSFVFVTLTSPDINPQTFDTAVLIITAVILSVLTLTSPSTGCTKTPFSLSLMCTTDPGEVSIIKSSFVSATPSSPVRSRNPDEASIISSRRISPLALLITQLPVTLKADAKRNTDSIVNVISTSIFFMITL